MYIDRAGTPDPDGYSYCIPDNRAERGQGVGKEASVMNATSPAGTLPGQDEQKYHLHPLAAVSSPYYVEIVGYQSLDEVPTDVSSLSVEEVIICLGWLNLHEHAETFRSKQIDGSLLMSLDRQMFLELGLDNFDAHKLEMFAHGWRPKTDTPSQSQHHVYYNQQQQQRSLNIGPNLSCSSA